MNDLGDTIALTYPTKPASPSTVTVTIGLPDGTTVGPTSATSGTYAYVPVQPGRHTVSWAATGPNDAYSDTFDVAPADPGYIISLADAKSQLRVTTSSNDEELRLYLASVTAIIEHECGAVLPVTVTETVEALPTIVLGTSPVMSLTSVTAGTQNPDFTVPGYTLDPEPGILTRTYQPRAWLFGTAHPQIVITYRAGRLQVPAPLQTAARIILESLWESRRLAGPKPAAEDETLPGAVIPSRAVELMQPFSLAPPVG